MDIQVSINPPGVQSWRAVKFESEREARRYINDNADGQTLFRLWVDSVLIVETRFPVMMVA